MQVNFGASIVLWGTPPRAVFTSIAMFYICVSCTFISDQYIYIYRFQVITLTKKLFTNVTNKEIQQLQVPAHEKVKTYK